MIAQPYPGQRVHLLCDVQGLTLVTHEATVVRPDPTKGGRFELELLIPATRSDNGLRSSYVSAFAADLKATRA